MNVCRYVCVGGYVFVRVCLSGGCLYKHEGEAVWGVSDCEGVCGVQGVSGCIGGVCVCVKVCVCV